MIISVDSSKIWFTSDTHYGQTNIVKGVSRWDNKSVCRDFNTVNEMNTLIVNNINKYVKEDDVLIHLGDWSFGGEENIWNFRKQLDCKNIHLLLGNHDVNIQKNNALDCCSKTFGIIHNSMLYYQNMSLNKPKEFEVYTQNLFSSVSTYLEIEIESNNKFLILSHYPLVSWNKMYKGSWMLHGHSHGTLFEKETRNHWYKNSKILDVGIDNAFSLFSEYRPFNFIEVADIMSNKLINSVDHHAKRPH